MNDNLPLKQALLEICDKDPRFDLQAYFFIKEAFDYTFRELKKAGEIRSDETHITGQILLNGIRKYALKQYGPMVMTLMKTWGIKTCKDFGHIVFNMVDHEVLGRSEQDSLDDFSAGYSFKEAFETPFLPSKKLEKIK